MGTRIAILGGGISALAAAYEIKRADPSDNFDITVYQMGWRLGGKCASSRNLSPGMDFRNEEHGLHVLGGWYHNTFEMLRAVYQDWNQLGLADSVPFADAFLALNGAVLFDQRTDILGMKTGWRKIAVRFPPPRGEPGLDVPDLSLRRMVRRMLDWVRHILKGSPDTGPDLYRFYQIPADADTMGRILADYDTAADSGWSDKSAETLPDLIGELADRLSGGVRRTADESRGKGMLEWMFPSGPGKRNGLSVFDYTCLAIIGLVMARGMLRDKLFTRGLDAANEEETMSWLRRHGAPDFVIRSPFVELGYHYAFSYIDGDPKRPDMAAGTALRGYLRMLFGQSGSFFYHFNGGIGEVLIKPLYDVLKARGVRFEFFCDVRALETDASGLRIGKVHIRRQARVKGGPDRYEPLFAIPGGPRVWPDAPLADQIEAAPGQESLPADFEDPADTGPGDPEEALSLGTDFDLAILAIPGTALKTICQGLAARSERWRNYLANVWSSPTLSAQVWTRPSLPDLGWSDLPPITTGHVLPLSTWCDMSHQLAFETPSRYTALHFLCGPHAQQRQDLRQLTENWLTDHFGDVLPRWQARRETLTERSLYVRFNTRPSDLYIFSPAGSVNHRLRCNGSGFGNLLLCGDWVRNGTDLGWVEGAITSARQCSRVLTNAPARIYGETDFG